MKFGLADHHFVKVNVLLKTDNICHPDAQQINKSDHKSSSSIHSVKYRCGFLSHSSPFETNTHAMGAYLSPNLNTIPTECVPVAMVTDLYGNGWCSVCFLGK